MGLAPGSQLALWPGPWLADMLARGDRDFCGPPRAGAPLGGLKHCHETAFVESKNKTGLL